MINLGCGCLAFILCLFILMILLKLGSIIILVLIGLIILAFIRKIDAELFTQIKAFFKYLFNKKEDFICKPGITYKECNHCGKKTERTAKFCADCGKPFEEV